MSESGGKDAFRQLMSTSNLCTNDQVSLSISILGAKLIDQVSCICRNQQEFERVGCDAGKIQPTVTTIIDKSQSNCVTDSITLSKCVSDPEAAYKTACASGQNMPTIASSAAGSATPSAPTQTPGVQVPQPSTDQPLPTTPGKDSTVPLEAMGGTANATPDARNGVGTANDSPKQNPQSAPGTPDLRTFDTRPADDHTIAPDVSVHPETFGHMRDASSPLDQTDDGVQNQRPFAQPPSNKIGYVLENAGSQGGFLNSLFSPLSSLFSFGGNQGSGGGILSLLGTLVKSLFSLFGSHTSPLQSQPSSLLPALVQPLPQPAATLTAYPRQVARGNPISLYWTLGGAFSDTSCTVYQNRSQIGQGLVGSLTIPTNATTPSSLSFILSCMRQGAVAGQERVDVSVTDDI